MKRTERIAAVFLASVIGGILLLLLTRSPIGTLGTIDGQSLEVDKFGSVLFIVLCLTGGLLFIRWQNKKP